jgi:hypothetical protein
MHADDLAATRQILLYCLLRFGHAAPFSPMKGSNRSAPKRMMNNVHQRGSGLSAFSLIRLAARELGMRANLYDRKWVDSGHQAVAVHRSPRRGNQDGETRRL